MSHERTRKLGHGRHIPHPIHVLTPVTKQVRETRLTSRVQGDDWAIVPMQPHLARPQGHGGNAP